MDEVTYSVLEKMHLENVRLIPLNSFEDDTLRKARQERTVAEYCWTCTAPLIIYVMQQDTQATHVAYLDADLFFYSNPSPIYDELGGNSILIIGHRFSKEYKAQESTSGIYNVGMVIFRSDPYGMECLEWWKERCLKSCRLNTDAGQCGDQKYLDDWPTRFKNVVVLQHKGGGLAPWNIFNYQLKTVNSKIYVDSDELIFYHFHSLQIGKRCLLLKYPILASGGYDFTKQHITLIYLPYAKEIHKTIKKVKEVDPHFVWGYKRLGFYEMMNALRKGKMLWV
ncbi:MAG: hypothetical protein HY097_10805 [Nitrospinae bacterium]|nr:hypothetical protein [Nitrospinota bacterium]MBI3813118.1 hypothetical protein [Nitrospinota bacterium]